MCKNCEKYTNTLLDISDDIILRLQKNNSINAETISIELDYWGDEKDKRLPIGTSGGFDVKLALIRPYPFIIKHYLEKFSLLLTLGYVVHENKDKYEDDKLKDSINSEIEQLSSEFKQAIEVITKETSNVVVDA